MTDQKEQSQGRIKKQRKPFVMSPTHLFTNPEISSIAKNLWNVLDSKPDGWVFFWSEIQKHFKEGRDAVRKSMKELEAFGYVQRKKAKKGNLLCGMDIEVFYDPTLPLDQENQWSARDTENQYTENQDSEIQDSKSQKSENRSAVNQSTKKEKSKQDLSKKDLSLSRVQSEIDQLLKKRDAEKERDFEVDVKKIFEYIEDETKEGGKLRASLTNVLKKLIELPINQIKNQKLTSSLPSDPLLVSKIKLAGKINEISKALYLNPNEFFAKVGKIIEAQEGFELYPVEDFDVEKWREILEKINVRVK